jgi:hypothetical protein
MLKEINNEKYRYYGNNHHQLVKSFKRGLMQIEIQQTQPVVPPKVKGKLITEGINVLKIITIDL